MKKSEILIKVIGPSGVAKERFGVAIEPSCFFLDFVNFGLWTNRQATQFTMILI